MARRLDERRFHLDENTDRVRGPVEVSEFDAPGDPVAMGELLARQNFDVVFFDSRIAKPARQELLNVIRAAPSRPLAVLIAPAMLKTREVFTDGLESTARSPNR